MAAISTFVAQRFLPYPKPPKPHSISVLDSIKSSRKFDPSDNLILSIVRNRRLSFRSVSEDRELVRLEENRSNGRQEQSLFIDGSEKIEDSSSFSEGKGAVEVLKGFSGRAVNATIVLGFGSLVVTKLLTIDHELWHVSFLAYWNYLTLHFSHLFPLVHTFVNDLALCLPPKYYVLEVSSLEFKDTVVQLFLFK